MTDYPIPISFPSDNQCKHIILLAVVVAAADDIRKHSFPLRSDIFPCTSCGEVFFKAHLLDLHRGQGQAMKHTLSQASRHCSTIASTMDERCIADGNECLWFYILFHHVVLPEFPECRWSIRSPYCCICEILRQNFRVVIGRVAHGGAVELMDVGVRGATAGGGGGMFESVALPSSGDDELIVFNVKPVLPCFVILYYSSLFGLTQSNCTCFI